MENSRSENVRQSILPDPAKLLLELTNALCFTANYDLYGLLQVSFEKFEKLKFYENFSHKREKVAIARKLKKAHLEEKKSKTLEQFKAQKDRINADR